MSAKFDTLIYLCEQRVRQTTVVKAQASDLDRFLQDMLA